MRSIVFGGSSKIHAFPKILSFLTLAKIMVDTPDVCLQSID